MFLMFDNRTASTPDNALGRLIVSRPKRNWLNQLRSSKLFILIAVGSVMIAGGCRSGRQVKDAEYCPVQRVGKTHWCPAPSDATEAHQLAPSRAAMIDEAYQKLEAGSLDDADILDDAPMLNDENGLNSAEPGTLGLTDLIRFALDQNPEIAIARKEIEIACAQIPQVSSLADPMVDIVSWPISSNALQTAGGRMTSQIMISQEVPWKGKRESRVGQAAREVNRLQNQKAAVEFKIANEVKQAWYDHWLVNQKLAIAEEDLAFLNDLLERAKGMYEGGSIGQDDLLRLQAEIGLNAASLASLEAERAQAHAELLRVLNWPPEQPLTFVASICEIEQARIPDRAVVLAQATTASPELQAIWAEVQRNQWKVNESRLDYYPDLKFSAGWGGMTTRSALAPSADGVDNLVAGVSFNLPVRIAARDAALRESESQVVKRLQDWERYRNQTERDVVKMHSALVSLKAQWEKYQTDIVPQLNDALEVMVAGYEVDQSDLSDLIILRREILQLREVEQELNARWCQTRANLAMLMAEVDW